MYYGKHYRLLASEDATVEENRGCILYCPLLVCLYAKNSKKKGVNYLEKELTIHKSSILNPSKRCTTMLIAVRLLLFKYLCFLCS